MEENVGKGWKKEFGGEEGLLIELPLSHDARPMFSVESHRMSKFEAKQGNLRNLHKSGVVGNTRLIHRR